MSQSCPLSRRQKAEGDVQCLMFPLKTILPMDRRLASRYSSDYGYSEPRSFELIREGRRGR